MVEPTFEELVRWYDMRQDFGSSNDSDRFFEWRKTFRTGLPPGPELDAVIAAVELRGGSLAYFHPNYLFGRFWEQWTQ